MVDSLTSESIEALQGDFSGEVLEPDDADYFAVRQVHNGMVDKRPALIARCQNTADIVDAAG